MAVKVPMPKLSDTMEEGVIAEWKVEEGDEVESGDIIADVETDKATMEMEVFDSGIIRKLIVNEGETVPLGNTVAVIADEDEEIDDLLEEIQQESADASEAEAEVPSEEESRQEEAASAEESTPSATSQPSPETGGNGAPTSAPSAPQPSMEDTEEEEDRRIKASPLARNMAKDRGIDLSRVEGSGPGGRIIKRDIEQYEEEPEAVPTAEPAAYASRESKEVRVSQMRKTIAKRLSESKFSYPHYYETIGIDMKRAITAREELNEVSDVKISFNDLIVKASALALRQHPWVNSSWNGDTDTITQHGEIHVAVAVAIEEGLLTPVIQNTDQKGIRQISRETKQLAERAKNKDLDMQEMEGSTFTVSNLGMFGIEEFTAIINPPNASILAVGAIQEKPVVEDGEVVPGKRMKVTLSSDHRIVDGAKAADFLNTLRQHLENPMSMLL